MAATALRNHVAETLNRVAYQGERTQPTALWGADAGFPEIKGGDLADGRWFTRQEVSTGASVASRASRMATNSSSLMPSCT